jgi:hypothetical protein
MNSEAQRPMSSLGGRPKSRPAAGLASTYRPSSSARTIAFGAELKTARNFDSL